MIDRVQVMPKSMSIDSSVSSGHPHTRVISIQRFPKAGRQVGFDTEAPNMASGQGFIPFIQSAPSNYVESFPVMNNVDLNNDISFFDPLSDPQPESPKACPKSNKCQFEVQIEPLVYNTNYATRSISMDFTSSPITSKPCLESIETINRRKSSYFVSRKGRFSIARQIRSDGDSSGVSPSSSTPNITLDTIKEDSPIKGSQESDAELEICDQNQAQPYQNTNFNDNNQDFLILTPQEQVSNASTRTKEGIFADDLISLV